jgi:hypothetical protein
MSRDLEGIERIRAGGAQGGKKPEDLTPQELHAVLWQILTFRDSGEWFLMSYLGGRHADSLNSLGSVVKKISKTIGEYFW